MTNVFINYSAKDRPLANEIANALYSALSAHGSPRRLPALVASEYFYLGRNRANIPKRAAIDAALLRLAPAIPPHERVAILDHAIDSRGLSVAAPETAAWLSLVAYVRHTFTDYDKLLAEGYDPDSARHFVAARTDKILQAWGVRHRLAPEVSANTT
jgi:hypothetical protein